MVLNKEQILAAQGRATVEIQVKELGGAVRLRAPSAGAVYRYRDLQDQIDKGKANELDAMLYVVKHAIVNDQNQVLFQDDDGARQFIEAVSLETLQVVVAEFGKLITRGKPAPAENPAGDAATSKREVPEEGKSEAGRG